MNTRPTIDESLGPVSLSASFNSNVNNFSVGTDTGFCVFNSEPCALQVSRMLNAGIGQSKMGLSGISQSLIMYRYCRDVR